MLAVADRYRARFQATFIRSMRHVAASLTAEVIADAMSEPIGVGRLWNLLDAAPIIKDAHSDALDAYAELASNAGHATLAVWKVPGTGRRAGAGANILAGLSARLDVKSPFMQKAAAEMSAKLVREVAAETKAAIRAVILDAHRNGIGPFEASKEIEKIVGLTSKQAQAVANFRQGLHDARDKVPGRRPLTSWSLAKLPKRMSYSPAQIDKLTGAYADRLLKYRAYNIARTETLYAANMGQQLTFKALAEAGMLDTATFRRVWSVVDDDRLCEYCAPMDGQSCGLEEDFSSTEKGVLPSERSARDEPVITEVPPLHPSCRCIIVTEQVESEHGPVAPSDFVPEPVAPPPAPEPPKDQFGHQLPGFSDAAGVFRALEAQDAGAVHALAFDGGDLERLELRLAQVDAHPGENLSTEVQFKLTRQAKERLLEEARGGKVIPQADIDAAMRAAYQDAVAAGKTDAEIDAAMRDAGAAVTARGDTEWRDLGHLSIPKRVDNVMKWDDPAFASNNGRTYEKIEQDGTRIRVHASDRGEAGAFAFDGMVQAWLPPAEHEADAIAALMRTVGVKDVSYPTEKAADAYARNQAAALFRQNAGQSTAEALARAERFGLNPADLHLAPGLNGQIEVRVPEAVANNLMDSTGTRFFTHTITARRTEGQTVTMIADMLEGGMKSTSTRWTEGLGGEGLSSPRDVASGGADYVFTRQIEAEALDSQGGTTFIFRGDRLLQRTDWFAYQTDTYGVQNPLDRLAAPAGHERPGLAARDSIKNLATNYARGAQETMFRGRIATEDLHQMVISDNHRRAAVIRELESRGITTIAGQPLRQIIVPYAGYLA